MDELFSVRISSVLAYGRMLRSKQMKLWPWQWQSATTTGLGSAVARAQYGNSDMEKNADIEHVSNQSTGFLATKERSLNRLQEDLASNPDAEAGNCDATRTAQSKF